MGHWDDDQQVESSSDERDGWKHSVQKHRFGPVKCWFPTGTIKELWKTELSSILHLHHHTDAALWPDLHFIQQIYLCRLSFTLCRIHSYFSLHNILKYFLLTELLNIEMAVKVFWQIIVSLTFTYYSFSNVQPNGWHHCGYFHLSYKFDL